MIEETGGSFGIRDENLLNSALNGIFQTFDGKDLYPTKEEKGAMLGYALISNHAFVDGNKRIGVYVMLTFLEVNGIRIKCTDRELLQAKSSMKNCLTGFSIMKPESIQACKSRIQSSTVLY